MRGFLAGGTGAVGRYLMPHLVENGHEVVVLVRAAEKARVIEAMGVIAAIVRAERPTRRGDRDPRSRLVPSAAGCDSIPPTCKNPVAFRTQDSMYDWRGRRGGPNAAR
jgi:nucleoside-diphosphate-sugar epimerase